MRVGARAICALVTAPRLSFPVAAAPFVHRLAQEALDGVALGLGGDAELARAGLVVQIAEEQVAQAPHGGGQFARVVDTSLQSANDERVVVANIICLSQLTKETDKAEARLLMRRDGAERQPVALIRIETACAS